MKITDLKQPVNEGIGDFVKSFIPGTASNIAGKMDKQTQMAYNVGLKDFVNKLSRAVTSGISSGVIQNPKTTQQPGATGAPVANQPTTQTPQTPQTPTAPSGQTTSAPSSQTTTPSGQTTALGQKTPAAASEPVQVSPGHRIELHDKSDNQLAYYKTDRGWFNAVNEPVPTKNTSSLEQAADAGGGAKYRAKEVPIPAAPPPMTKGGRQANQQARQNKKQPRARTNEGAEFDYLNYLVESRILNEATVSQYINKFIMNQVKNYDQDPDYKQAAANLAQQLEKSYVKDGTLDQALLKQTWDLLWNWSHLGKGGSRDDYSGVSTSQLPDTPEAKNIQKTGKFLMQAATNPELLTDPEYEAYKGELEKIIKQMK